MKEIIKAECDYQKWGIMFKLAILFTACSFDHYLHGDNDKFLFVMMALFSVAASWEFQWNLVLESRQYLYKKLPISRSERVKSQLIVHLLIVESLVVSITIFSVISGWFSGYGYIWILLFLHGFLLIMAGCYKLLFEFQIGTVIIASSLIVGFVAVFFIIRLIYAYIENPIPALLMNMCAFTFGYLIYSHSRRSDRNRNGAISSKHQNLNQEQFVRLMLSLMIAFAIIFSIGLWIFLAIK